MVMPMVPRTIITGMVPSVRSQVFHHFIWVAWLARSAPSMARTLTR